MSQKLNQFDFVGEVGFLTQSFDNQPAPRQMFLSQNAPSGTVILPGTPVKYATGGQADPTTTIKAVVPITAVTDPIIGVATFNSSKARAYADPNNPGALNSRACTVYGAGATISFKAGANFAQGDKCQYNPSTGFIEQLASGSTELGIVTRAVSSGQITEVQITVPYITQ